MTPTEHIAQWMDQKLGPAHEGLTVGELTALVERRLGYWTDPIGVGHAVAKTKRWETRGSADDRGETAGGIVQRIYLHHGSPLKKRYYKPRPPIIGQCRTCGADYRRMSNERRCADCRAANPSGKVRPPVIRQCVVCGRDFRRTAHQLRCPACQRIDPRGYKQLAARREQSV